MGCFIKEGSLMMSMLYRHGVTFPKDVKATLLKNSFNLYKFFITTKFFSRRQRKRNACMLSNDQHINNNFYICIVFYSV